MRDEQESGTRSDIAVIAHSAVLVVVLCSAPFAVDLFLSGEASPMLATSGVLLGAYGIALVVGWTNRYHDRRQANHFPEDP